MCGGSASEVHVARDARDSLEACTLLKRSDSYSDQHLTCLIHAV